MRLLLVTLLTLTLQTAWAQQEVPEPLPPPPLPDGALAPPEDELEPQVTIIQRDRDVIEEYRVNNQLYMVRIVPTRGRPYYLIDTDGDGDLETRRNELDNPEVPQWVLFRW